MKTPFENSVRDNRFLKAVLFLVVAAGLLVSSAQAERFVARYQVKDGAFWDLTTRRHFVPYGFNYIRLHYGHGTFDPAHYDQEAVGTMFRRLRKDGFNTVRVFINGHASRGAITAKDEKWGFSQAYVANVADFLRQADENYVAVVLSMDHMPKVSPYTNYAKKPSWEIHQENAEELASGHVKAKALFLKNFIKALRSTDPKCLKAVLAYDLQNELNYVMAPPFTITKENVRMRNGKTYNLPAQRQALADDAATSYINTLADAIHAVHYRAPIWVSVFTYRGVGKTGPGHFQTEKAKWKNRVPFRPLAIVRSKADVLDIHFYCPTQRDFDTDLQSIEFEDVKLEAKERGKVLVAGEFGAFKKQFKTPQAAADWMGKLTTLFNQQGINGWLYWTYDTFEQDSELWHACVADGVIYQRLRNAEKKRN